jgi:maleamate amidohydrolase
LTRGIIAQNAPPGTELETRMASIDKFNDHCWKDVIPEADLALYAGWRRETFIGPRPALLVIDLYDLVYRGGTRPPLELNNQYPNTCGMFAHRAIEPTKRLFAAARSAGIPIFYCTQETRPNNRPKGAVSTRNQRPRPGPDGYAIYHEFTPEPSDVVIWKQRASAFQGTPLFSHLSILGIQSLIVCGESTSGCVRASVVDAYSNGFHISLVEECTFDRAELTHKVNLFDMHHKYADVMHIEEVVAHLDGLRLAQAAE